MAARRRAAPFSRTSRCASRHRRVLLVASPTTFAVFLGTGATLGPYESLTLLPDRLRAQGQPSYASEATATIEPPETQERPTAALDALVGRRVR